MILPLMIVILSGLFKVEYQYYENLEERCGMLMKDHLIIGKLDKDGGLIQTVTVKPWEGELSGYRLNGPRIRFLNSVKFKDDRCYELRKEMLVEGTLASYEVFQESKHPKSLVFKKYKHRVDLPIWNLPGVFLPYLRLKY